MNVIFILRPLPQQPNVVAITTEESVFDRRVRGRGPPLVAMPRRVNPYVLTKADLTEAMRRIREMGVESARAVASARAEIELLHLMRRDAVERDSTARRKCWWLYIGYGTIITLLALAWIRERFPGCFNL